MIINPRTVADADRWLDADCGPDYHAQPLAQDWARLAKVGEELGEAIQELILWTAQNPRKPQDPDAGTRLLKEIADVVATGILCIQHFTKDIGATQAVITANFDKIDARIPDNHRTIAPLPRVDDATDRLTLAVARWHRALNAEPHADSDAEIEYAHDLMKLAARELTRAVDAQRPDRQPAGWGGDRGGR